MLKRLMVGLSAQSGVGAGGAHAETAPKNGGTLLAGGSVRVFNVARLSNLPNTCVTTKGREIFASHA